MTEKIESIQDIEFENDIDQWIEVAAKSVGYENGFGLRGCDLSQTHWWAAYIRQSTEEQKSNSRLPEYLRTCASEAKKLGLLIPREYILYDAMSGEHLERPGIIYLRRELAPGRRIAGVVFPALDRLSREPAHIAIFEFEMEYVGVRCHYADAPNGSDPMSQMMRQALAHAAKYVKIANRKNNRAENIGRALKGIVPAHKPSYGYIYRSEYREESGRRSVIRAWWEVDRLGPDGVPEPETPAWVVQQAFTWIASQEKTLHWVAAELNRLNIPTAGGSRWNPGKVQRLIGNRCYTGDHAYNVHARVPSPGQRLTDITAEIKRNRKQPKPESEWVYYKVPTLVPADRWEKANRLLRKRGRGRGKQGKAIQALLRGRVYCPGCSQPMIVRRHPKYDHLYYHCRVYGRKWEASPCTYSTFIPGSWDDVVWADICSMLRDDHWLEQEFNAGARQEQGITKLIDAQERKISLTKHQLARIQQGFEREIYTLEQARDRTSQLRTVIEDAEQEAIVLRNRAGATPRTEEEIQKAREELAALRDRNLHDAGFVQRYELVAQLGLQVYPAEDLKSMRVKCQLPFNGSSMSGDLKEKPTGDPGKGYCADRPEPECDKVPSPPPICRRPDTTATGSYGPMSRSKSQV